VRYAIAALALVLASCADGGQPYAEHRTATRVATRHVEPTRAEATATTAPTRTPTPVQLAVPWAWLSEAQVPILLWVEFAAVGLCESGWTPGSVGDGGSSYGWLQIQPRYHQWRLVDLGYEDNPALLFDPVIAAEVALHIYQGHGWAPWTCQP